MWNTLHAPFCRQNVVEMHCIDCNYIIQHENVSKYVIFNIELYCEFMLVKEEQVKIFIIFKCSSCLPYLFKSTSASGRLGK